MVAELEAKVVKFAIVSRLVVVLLLVIAGILPHHVADIFSPPITAASWLDRSLLRVLSGFLQWDSRYYLFVGTHDYLFQQSLVFLPLFPALSRALSFLLSPLPLCLPVRILLAGVLLNNAAFVLSARLLYRLGVRVLGDNSLSYTAALLFCLTPASVFFSVLYTESLFFLLGLAGLVSWAEGRTLRAALFFGLSGACRSNGLLFTLFPALSTLSVCLFYFRRSPSFSSFVFSCIFSLVPASISLVLSVLPFLLTQATAFHRFCAPLPFLSSLPALSNVSTHLRTYAAQRGYLLPDSRPAWCNNTLPLSYSAIQAEHWEVGLFRYFNLRQLPNFVLATPVLVIAAVGSAEFARRYPGVLGTLGMSTTKMKKIEDAREREGVRRTVPFMAHLLAVLLLLTPTIHVQVLTRIVFSSSPCIYWILAHLFTDRVFVYDSLNPYSVFERLKPRESSSCVELLTEIRRSGNLLLDKISAFWQLSCTRKLLLSYILGYCFVGTMLHGVCLPWT